MDDLSVVNGTVWLNSGWVKAHLAIRNGKIVAVSSRPQPARETISAQGLLVLPGLLDPHVHFDLGVGSTVTADGFSGGSRAAAHGGVTTVIDFLDPVRTAEEMEQAFETRSGLASQSSVDYAFHATLARPEDEAMVLARRAVALGCPSLKVFTAYSSTDRRTSYRDIESLLVAGKTCGTTVLVHAEDESMMDPRPGTPVARHEESRPALCEVVAVLALAELVKNTGGRMSVVHTNVGTTVERLTTLHQSLLGQQLFLESCPHYLLWDKGRYARDDGGRFTMTPPLRSRDERQRLVKNFHHIDTLGTDHCAYHSVQKDHGTTDKIAMGIGGVEFMLPSLWGLFGEQCLPKLTDQTAKVHGLWPQKGHLGPGADADFVLFDPKARWRVEGHHGDADHTAWLGEPMRGRIVSTFLRGEALVRDGEFLGAAGRFVRRSAHR